MKPKILCVCTMGTNRSKYLAGYLKRKGYLTRYGGLGHSKLNLSAQNPLKNQDISWADIIITARKRHGDILKKKYNLKEKKIIILDVMDFQKKVCEIHPEFKNLDGKIFQRKWTYSQLRKSIKPFLPLTK